MRKEGERALTVVCINISNRTVPNMSGVLTKLHKLLVLPTSVSITTPMA